jgi:hypothetical protein
VIGNGPSLKEIPLEFLASYPSFGSNRIYLLPGFCPTYYVAVNPLVIEQSIAEIAALNSHAKFIGAGLAGKIPGALPLRSIPLRRFSFAPESYVYEGYSVTFVALQLAYYMGFTKALLVGVDHSYQVSGEPNQEVVATGPDPNHFHPAYFSDGARWHNPDLKRSKEAYRLAQQAYRLGGRKVLNLTPGTKLQVFPKADWRRFERGGPKKSPPETGGLPSVSAIVSAYYTKDFLPGRIENLLGQTHRPEVVVVCHEGSEEWRTCQEYGNEPGFVTVALPEGSNIPTVYEAWNRGIAASSGELITNANSDDRLFPDALLHAAMTLKEHPEAAAAYFDMEIAKAHGGPPENFFTWREGGLGELLQGCFLGPAPVWRRSLHEKHGLFNTWFQSAGDYEFWLRIASAGERFCHMPEILGRYLERPDSIEHRLAVRATWEAARARAMYRTTSVDRMAVKLPQTQLRGER